MVAIGERTRCCEIRSGEVVLWLGCGRKMPEIEEAMDAVTLLCSDAKLTQIR